MIHFTNRKGERLPEDINKVANEYYDNMFRPNSNNELELYDGFLWDNTLEKYDIWLHVCGGNYQPFYKFHNPVKAKQARKAEIIAEIEKLQNELKEL